VENTTLTRAWLRNRILALAFFGLFIRLALMPLTFHHDIEELQYMLQEVADGHLNVYKHYEDKYKSGPMYWATYPPMYFYIAGSFRPLSERLSPSLRGWLEHCWGTYKTVYSGIPGAPTDDSLFYENPGFYRLFRNLFLVKAPYLLFDAAVAVSLLLLVADPRKKVLAFTLWTFNPFQIITSYGHGHYDIIPTALVVLALLLIHKRRPGPALALLSVGFMTKLYPAIFIPPLLLYYSKDSKQFLRLVAWTVLPLAVVIIPSYIATHGTVLRHFFVIEATERATDASLVRLLQKLLFLLGYLLVLAHSFFSRRNSTGERQAESGERIIISLLLLLCLAVGLEIRYFVWVTPFIILLMMRNRAFFWLGCLQGVAFVVLRLPQYSALQWRLFRPLEPNLFNNLPTIDRLMQQVVHTSWLYPICYRLFLLASLCMLIRLWWVEAVQRFVKDSVIAVSAKFLAASLLLFTLVCTAVGARLYFGTQVGNASRVKWTAAAPVTLGTPSADSVDRVARRSNGFFQAVDEGLCATGGLKAAGSAVRGGQEILFRPLDIPGPWSAEGGLEVDGKTFGRRFTFEPRLESAGKTYSVELYQPDGSENQPTATQALFMTCEYTWTKSWSDTIAFLRDKLSSDPVFFYLWRLALATTLALAAFFLSLSLFGIDKVRSPCS